MKSDYILIYGTGDTPQNGVIMGPKGYSILTDTGNPDFTSCVGDFPDLRNIPFMDLTEMEQQHCRKMAAAFGFELDEIFGCVYAHWCDTEGPAAIWYAYDEIPEVETI